VADGTGILGQIFGSMDVSREVAARAATQTGIGQDVLKQMLPMVAALVMGALARRGAQGGGLAGLQAGLDPTGRAGGGILDMLTPMLDANRDGSVIDDLIGKFLK
jgi:hypothetical protein